MDLEKIAETIPGTAKLLGIDVKTLRAGVAIEPGKSGHVPSFQVGEKRRLIPMWWIRQQLNGTGKAA